ncbi:MAG: cyclase family protein [Pseudomonadota bacterium]
MAFFLDEYEVIDLTMDLGHDFPAWPATPLVSPTRIWRDHNQSETGVNQGAISMSLHTCTHLDGQWHIIPRYKSKLINEEKLEGRLVGEGVIVDISGMVEEYGFYGKKEILSAGVEIKKGDILFVHTGHHKYQHGQPYADEIAYFYRQPGVKKDFAEWCLEMEFNYLGIDGGTMDHPFATNIVETLPAEREKFLQKHGVKSVAEVFGAGKMAAPMHLMLFEKGMIHVENLGGEISRVKNKRCVIGTFPLKIIAESSPCRVVAFVRRDS